MSQNKGPVSWEAVEDPLSGALSTQSRDILGWPLLYCVKGRPVLQGWNGPPDGSEPRAWSYGNVTYDDGATRNAWTLNPNVSRVWAHLFAGRYRWDASAGRSRYQLAVALYMECSGASGWLPVVATYSGLSSPIVQKAVREAVTDGASILMRARKVTKAPPHWWVSMNLSTRELSGTAGRRSWSTTVLVPTAADPQPDRLHYLVPSLVADHSEAVRRWRDEWREQ